MILESLEGPYVNINRIVNEPIAYQGNPIVGLIDEEVWKSFEDKKNIAIDIEAAKAHFLARTSGKQLTAKKYYKETILSRYENHFEAVTNEKNESELPLLINFAYLLKLFDPETQISSELLEIMRNNGIQHVREALWKAVRRPSLSMEACLHTAANIKVLDPSSTIASVFTKDHHIKMSNEVTSESKPVHASNSLTMAAYHRILFPEKKPLITPYDTKFNEAKDILTSTDANFPLLSHMRKIKHAFDLSILAADDITIDENGLHLFYMKKRQDGGIPLERKF